MDLIGNMFENENQLLLHLSSILRLTNNVCNKDESCLSL